MQLLRDKGHEPDILEYLKTPLSVTALSELCQKLGKSPGEIVRTKEAIFSELNLDLNDSSKVLEAIVKNPVLLERPIIVRENKAVIGRPPENLLGLL